MQQKSIRSQGLIWVLALYGTTVGAGTLFLPVEIGIRGPTIFFAMLILAMPLSLLPHKLLCRVYMINSFASSSDKLFSHCIDKKSNFFWTILYFLAFYPVVLVYGISLINTIENYLTSHMHQPAINRAILSFICITVLFSIVSKGRDKVVRTMGILALPFALSIMTIAVAMIPQWDLSLLTQQLQQLDKNTLRISLKELWLSLPLITFSFGCAPIILPLASYYQQKKEEGKRQALKIINVAYVAIFISILFFVLSCVACIPRSNFEIAKKENLSVLSVMTSGGGLNYISFIAPFIALIGMTKSFLGVSLSVTDTFAQLVSMCLPGDKLGNHKAARRLSILFLYLFTWFVVYINPNVITLIETLCGPLIAVVIYLVPTYIVYKFDAFKVLRCKISLFIMFSGFATLSALIYTIL